MPDVREYAAEVKKHSHQEQCPDDEITRIASKVLSDLEAFVNDDSDTESLGSEGDDNGRKASAVIGVSLDELRLILDTSIRRHVDHEASPRRPQHASVNSSSPAHSKRNVKIYPRPSARSPYPPLSELQQLLQSKQQAFARLREDNRAAERLSGAEGRPNEIDAVHRRRGENRDRRDERMRWGHEKRGHDNYRHWNERMSFSSVEKSPQSSAFSSSPRSMPSSISSAQSQSKHGPRDQPRLLRNNQATETDDAWGAPVPEQTRPRIDQAEKACGISPSDLGPAISDLPATTALELSGQPKSPPSKGARADGSSRERYHNKKSTRSQASESGWSSSSSSSRSQSSVDSETSRRHTRRLHREDRSQDSDRDSHYRLLDSQLQHKTEPASPPVAMEQLDWELDLSNFNI